MNEKRFETMCDASALTTSDFLEIVDKAKDPSTSKEVLISLATNEKLISRDANYRLRDALMNNSETPIEALEALSEYFGCRYGVARHKNATIKLIRDMLNTYNGDMHIEQELCNRLKKCTDSDTLEQYADDELASVRAAVAVNRNTSKKIRKRLSEDRHDMVRRATK